MKNKYQISGSRYQVTGSRILVTCYLLLTTCLLFTACDYVANPVLSRSNTNSNNGNNNIPIPDSVGYQNILAEDYTGMYCENCPRIATAIENLVSAYRKRVIPLAVNYGYYAVPPLPSPYNNWDFTTPCGNAYGDLFVTASGSFPNGMVNRMHYPQGLHNLGNASVLTDSAVNILTVNTSPPGIYIDIKTSFNSLTGVLTTTVNTFFLKAYTGNYNMALLLVQDSIIAPQKDTIGSNNPTYAHRYALRDNITASTWGDNIATNPVIKQVSSKTYAYTVQPGYPQNPLSGCPKIPCDYKKCYVIAYIYDNTTSSPTQYQVIQAQQKKIYP